MLERSVLCVLATALAVGVCASGEESGADAQKEVIVEGHKGIASRYPGDAGIAKDPDVVFTEDFETRGIDGFKGHWSSVSNKGGCFAFSDDVAPGSGGKRSLGMTAKRGENEGGHLFTRFKPGWDELYARCYAKFSDDYGWNHHFVKLQGAVNPPPWPMGGAGSRPTTTWTTGLEPTSRWGNTYPGKTFPPPGHWFFYSYWPEMHSWQTPEGRSDGRPRAYFGNAFSPWEPVKVVRAKWICLEWMVRMNSAVDKHDGCERFWIDGKLMGNWSPGTPSGYWMRDTFRCDPNDKRSKPFEGFRWRKNAQVRVNKFWLLHYVSTGTWPKVDKYKADHPDFKLNTRQYTVWFDDVVLAKKYIGPIFTKKAEAGVKKTARAPSGDAAKREARAGTLDEQEAGHLYQMARRAYLMGQKSVARQLYGQIVQRYPATKVAEKARAKLN